MKCSSEDSLIKGIEELAAPTKISGIELYDSRGRPVSPGAEPGADVAAFLKGAEEKDVRIFRDDHKTTLTALARIQATKDCRPCHQEGAILGALVVHRDLTAALAGARQRTGVGLALLIGGWLIVVALLDILTRRFARTSVDRLQTRVRQSTGSTLSPRAPLSLESFSGELYRKLEETLQRHEQERAGLEDRFERAERLASIGQLAAGVAHEIKNPLAGVQGVLEILVEDCRSDERIDLYRRMLDELRRVNSTLHSLLQFARPQKPKKCLTKIDVLLEDVVELARPGLARRDISLNYEVASGLETFHLDPSQIRQVLINLINNAGEAISKTGTIGLQASPYPEGDGLILAVSDDGQGMDEETSKKVFEPFFTTKLHGTGLGLAVARRIVEEHGGKIEISSEPGHGCTVFLLLPGSRDTGAN